MSQLRLPEPTTLQRSLVRRVQWESVRKHTKICREKQHNLLQTIAILCQVHSTPSKSLLKRWFFCPKTWWSARIYLQISAPNPFAFGFSLKKTLDRPDSIEAFKQFFFRNNGGSPSDGQLAARLFCRIPRASPPDHMRPPICSRRLSKGSRCAAGLEMFRILKKWFTNQGFQIVSRRHGCFWRFFKYLGMFSKFFGGFESFFST